jgi:hypothetical protein
MLTEFNQNTIANMTAALEYVCKQIPPEGDAHAVRTQIADAIIESANGGRRSLIDFQNAGLRALEDIALPSKSNWFTRLFRRQGRFADFTIPLAKLVARPRPAIACRRHDSRQPAETHDGRH